MRNLRYFKLLLFSFLLSSSLEAQQVKVIQKNEKWDLHVNGKSFFIKGVVGNSWPEKIKFYGGNSTRIGWRKADLDEAQKLGLKTLVNLPAGAERNGFDYNDTAAVRKQTEKIIRIVKDTKDHPAVLMWSIGNELDFIPPTLPYNLKVWDAVNEAAKAIKAIDPNHPVMTVIGTSMMEKVGEIVKRCPDIDLLGINTYGDIYTLPETLRKYGWTKPFIISEWGPDGYWEVRKTSWKAPYEQTGREKYDCYQKKYTEAILKAKGQCLGSYVFYWSGDKQETTHTWFTMFNKEGLETPLVGLMHTMWTGKQKANNAPVVDSLNIENYVRYQDIILATNRTYKARCFAADPDRDSLQFAWEIRPEASYASYAGQGEKEPMPLEGLIAKHSGIISFKTPAKPGAYRLFVYAYDGKGHFSSANLPFLVKKDISDLRLLPALPDTSEYGRYTSRTMHLLQNSTPAKPNTVKILVYGQSISAQNWWLSVKKDIEQKFPNANLVMENKAIGGFASQLLCKTVEMDVSFFYPDLVLLHIYGSDKMYDSVLHTIRSRTTAEIAIQTDHYTGTSKWSDNMSYHILPKLAEKYKCDIINIRDPWKKFLKDNDLDSSQLLSDAVHLNEFGNMLMAELIKPLFTYKSKFEPDPFQLVKTYNSDKDFKVTSKNFTFEFEGNRLDLILDNSEGKFTSTVWLDNKKPSEFQGTYFMSRPYNNKGDNWPWNLPAMIHVGKNTPWIAETWTLRFTEAKPPYDDFSFEIEGSSTGKEGSGKGSEDFVSPSGRVVIAKDDADNGGEWHLKRSYKVVKAEVKTGDEIFWKTYSISLDGFNEKNTGTVTLFQGVPNTKHVLRITSAGNKKPPVKQIVVYKPFLQNKQI